MLQLTNLESDYCVEFGYYKKDESVRRGLKDKAAFKDEWKGIYSHIKGCFGEALFSKWLTGEVLPLEVNQDQTGKADVLGYEVKATMYSDGHVYVPAWAKPGQIVVVVCWCINDGIVEGYVSGWFYQHEAFKYPREKGKGSHMVPATGHHSMDTLPRTDEYNDWVNSITTTTSSQGQSDERYVDPLPP